MCSVSTVVVRRRFVSTPTANAWHVVVSWAWCGTAFATHPRLPCLGQFGALVCATRPTSTSKPSCASTALLPLSTALAMSSPRGCRQPGLCLFMTLAALAPSPTATWMCLAACGAGPLSGTRHRFFEYPPRIAPPPFRAFYAKPTRCRLSRIALGILTIMRSPTMYVIDMMTVCPLASAVSASPMIITPVLCLLTFFPRSTLIYCGALVGGDATTALSLSPMTNFSGNATSSLTAATNSLMLILLCAPRAEINA